MRLASGLLVLAALASACGGGGDAPETPPAADATPAPAESVAEAGALVVSGEPVAFAPASGPDLTVEVGTDGSCVVPETSFDDQPDEITLCAGHFSGAGGDFVVATIGRAVDRYDVGVLCSSGGDNYHLTAAALGAGTPVIQQFDFAEVGEVAGVVLFEGLLAESDSAPTVLVAQPEGATCPQYHGVGEVGADLVTQGGLNGATVLGYPGPDGNLGTCTRVAGGGFVTEPASGDTCPED